MPVPDLDRIDAVPVRALARLQQEIDRRRARPAGGVGLRITEGLGEIPTFGMRLQAERGDDLVCGHAYITSSLRMISRPPKISRPTQPVASTLTMMLDSTSMPSRSIWPSAARMIAQAGIRLPHGIGRDRKSVG